ncbi:hypothetical protein AN639_00005 [Candidatus Epulonipiscium fishelsonii]|uniref:Uncharacterized protein n=2 Tax=Candidatus Epulonipiscium fishelsonii TaxID=77094 RepID=A0ACC8XCV2_9FIRM|nr:hypothetical protein AN396_05930 [Epulopiscium sp. SCG-B11WGA-EpuloA1]ONI41599.1 hypothetical protein AN396_03315 [Epulopiscium sp. SCG-B11WGA-EpuloA1]ONI43911.1 hypothetical protein AN639_00005 [Epulopiscium sp. SCG-B05WGA-EpuloA1]
MELQIFGFVDEVLDKLDAMREEVEIASKEIEEYFKTVLDGNIEGYLNINTRVKSRSSLKEKILRYDYYSKYKTVETLYEKLSDLVGIRIECRFIEDELIIYKLIKAHFNSAHDKYIGYSYNKNGNNMFLEITTKQPKEQKNGIKMYRIDGKYLFKEQIINFEIQIKSLVNIFWSEIEHKVIYKNYNYIVADRFYKDIMRSIKNSLSTIDQQLLLISNQFERFKSTTLDIRNNQVETLLSKIIYDLFAERMKKDIGLLVDFRKSCDTLVKYILRDVSPNSNIHYNALLVAILNRLNAIDESEINFNKVLAFERKLAFKDEFTLIIGNHIQSVLNKEFQWNLFFRILFYIEPENNTSDLENFLEFYKKRMSYNLNTSKLKKIIGEKETSIILDELLIKFANTFVEINSVQLLYDNIIEELKIVLNSVLDKIARNVTNFDLWETQKSIYFKLLWLRMFDLSDNNIDTKIMLDFIEEIKTKDLNIDLHKNLQKYILNIQK